MKKNKPNQANENNAAASTASTADALALEPRMLLDGAMVETAEQALNSQDETEVKQAIDEAVKGRAPAAWAIEREQSEIALLDALGGEQAKYILFIDSAVEDRQSILDSVAPNIEVHILDSHSDGVVQIGEHLRGRSDIESIHIISHGNSGTLDLGNAKLTKASMVGKHAAALELVRDSLSENGDIHIYGCNFAERARGQAAIESLSLLTGADISASDDKTGAEIFGGDWEMEYTEGKVETPSLRFDYSSTLSSHRQIDANNDMQQISQNEKINKNAEHGVLANDRARSSDGQIYVAQVNGKVNNVGMEIIGSKGGVFIVNADGSYTFDPKKDFIGLGSGETKQTYIQYTIVDQDLKSDVASLIVTVAGTDDGVVQSTILPVQAAREGDVLGNFETAHLFGDDSEGKEYRAENLPTGLSINSETGVIYGTFGWLTGEVGFYEVDIYATDTQTNQEQVATLIWEVEQPQYENANIRINSNRDTVVIDLTNTPFVESSKNARVESTRLLGAGSITEFSANPPVIYYTPNVGASGDMQIEYTLVNERGHRHTERATITIEQMPYFYNRFTKDKSATAKIGETVYYNAASLIRYEGRDDLTYTLTNAPSGLSIDSETGIISGIIDEDGVIEHNKKVLRTSFITAQNENGLQFTTKLIWRTLDVAESATKDVVRTEIGTSVIIAPAINDGDGDGNGEVKLQEISKQPRSGSVIINDDGTVTYTPNGSFVGKDSFKIKIYDGESKPRESTVEVKVARNSVPYFNFSNLFERQTTATIGESITMLSTIGDVNISEPGLSFTFGAINLPEGLTIDSDTGIVSGTPSENLEPGDYEIIVYGYGNKHGYQLAKSYTITLEASDAETPPPPASAVEKIARVVTKDGRAHTTHLIDLADFVSDTEGGAVTFSTQSTLPAGLRLNSDGTISGTVASSVSQGGEDGLYTIAVSASDGVNSHDFSFEIFVEPTTPTLHSVYYQLAEDASYNGNVFTQGVIDLPHGDKSRLTIVGYSGDIDASEPPAEQTFSTAVAASHGGTVLMNPDGSYTLDTGSDFDNLQAGEPSGTSFVYFVRDTDNSISKGKISFLITGANDEGVVTAVERLQTRNLAEHTTPLVNLAQHITDPDDTYTFATTSTLPEGLVLNSDGTLTGTVGAEARQGGVNGIYTIEAIATASASGETHTISFEIEIQNGPPEIRLGTVTLGQNDVTNGNIFLQQFVVPTETAQQGLSVVAFSSDTTLQQPPDVQTLPTSITASNGGLFSISADGSYTFNTNNEFNSLALDETGTSEIIYFVSDSQGGISRGQIIFTIEGANDAPTPFFSTTTVSTNPDEIYSSDATRGLISGISDVDTSDTHSVVKVNNVAGNVATSVRGNNGGTFFINADGSYRFDPGEDFKSLRAQQQVATSIGFQIADNHGVLSEGLLTVNVIGADDGYEILPTLPVNAFEGVEYSSPPIISFADYLRDIEGEPVSATFTTASPLPSGLVLNTDGTLTGTIVENNRGFYIINAVATDDAQRTYELRFELTVVSVPLIVEAGDYRLAESQTFTSNLFEDNLIRGQSSENIRIVGFNAGAAGTPVGQQLSDSELLTNGVAGSQGGMFYLDGQGNFRFDTNGDFNDLSQGKLRHSQIRYFVEDSEGQVFSQLLKFSVVGANAAPHAESITASTDKYSTITTSADNGLLSGEIDIDSSDILTITEINGVAENIGVQIAGTNGGQFTINADGSYTFNSNGEFSQLDGGEFAHTSISFTVADNHGATKQVELIIEVAGVAETFTIDRFPYLGIVDGDGPRDTFFSLRSYITNIAEGTNLVFTTTDALPEGLVLHEDGRIGGHVANDASSGGDDGVYRIQVLISDLEHTHKTVTLELSASNQLPVAGDRTFSVRSTYNRDVEIFEDGIAFDRDNDGLTIVGFTNDLSATAPPENQIIPTDRYENEYQKMPASNGGRFYLNQNGFLFFESNDDFRDLPLGQTRQSSVKYFVQDGDGEISSGIITFEVAGENEPPWLPTNAIGVVVDEDGIYQSTSQTNLLANVTDVDIGDTVSIKEFRINDQTSSNFGVPIRHNDGGLITINRDGSYIFDTNGDFNHLNVGETHKLYIGFWVHDQHGETTNNRPQLIITITGSDDALEQTPIEINPITVQEGALHLSSNPIASFAQYINDPDNEYYFTATTNIENIGLIFSGSGVLYGEVFPRALHLVENGRLPVEITATNKNNINEQKTISFDLIIENPLPTALDFEVATSEGGVIASNIFNLEKDGRSLRDTDDDAVRLVGLANDIDATQAPSNHEFSDVSEKTNGIAGSNGGIFYIARNGELRFEATKETFANLNAGQTRQTSIRYFIDDGQGGTASGLVTINVAGIDDITSAVADSTTTNQDTKLEVNAENGVLANDRDPDENAQSEILNVVQINGGDNVGKAVRGTAGGLFTINQDGSYIFNPNGDFNDLDEGESRITKIEYTVSTRLDTIGTTTLTVLVTGTDDAITISTVSEQNYNVGDEITNIEVADIFGTSTNSIKYAAHKLPSGIEIDETSGIISGTLGRDATGHRQSLVHAINEDSGEIKTIKIVWQTEPQTIVSETTTYYYPNEHAPDASLPLKIIPFSNIDIDDWKNWKIVSVESEAASASQFRIYNEGEAPFFTYSYSRTSTSDIDLTYNLEDIYGNTMSGTVTIAERYSRFVVYNSDSPLPTSFAVGELVRGEDVSLNYIYGGQGTANYEAINLPKGLSIDSATGAISGTVSQDRQAETERDENGILITKYRTTIIINDDLGNRFNYDWEFTINNRDHVVQDDYALTTPNTAVAIVPTANDVDRDGDTIKLESITSTPAKGTAVINSNGTITYTPNNDFLQGRDQFTITTIDSFGATQTSTVFVDVANMGLTTRHFSPEFTLPDMSHGTAITPIDLRAGLENQIYDLKFGAANLPKGLEINKYTGVISGVIDSAAYKQSPYEVVVYAFDDVYQTTKKLTLNVLNQPPLLNDNIGYANAGEAFTFYPLADDHDPEGTQLNIVETSTAENGGVAINADGSLTYTANENFAGTETFTYTVADENGSQSTATITIHVGSASASAQIDILPTVQTTTGATTSDSFIDLSNHFIDPDGDAVSFSTTSTLPEGLTLNSDGTIVGTISKYAAGNEVSKIFRIEIVATDSSENTKSETLEIIVANNNPIATAGSYEVQENANHIGNIFTDGLVTAGTSSGETLSVVSYSGNVNLQQAPDVQILPTSFPASNGGTISMQADGSFTFSTGIDFDDLAQGQSRQTSFVYFVSDGEGGIAKGTISFTVNGANDAPFSLNVLETTNKNTIYNAAVGEGVLASAVDVDDNDVITLSQINGEASNIGQEVAGTNGGKFIIAADGSYTFNPNGEFDSLSATQSQRTTVYYTIVDSNGASSSAELTIVVTGGESETSTVNLAAVNGKDGTQYTTPLIALSEHLQTAQIETFTFSTTSTLPEGLTLNSNGEITGLISESASTTNGGIYSLEVLATSTTSTTNHILAFDIIVADTNAETSTGEYTIYETQSHSGNIFTDGLAFVADKPQATLSLVGYSGDISIENAPDEQELGRTFEASNGGTISMNADGSYTFNTNGDFEDLTIGQSRQTSFVYFVADVDGDISKGMVTLTINYATPTISDGSYTISEDETHSGDVFTDGLVSYAGGDIATLSIISYSGDVSLTQAPDVQTLPTEFAASNGGTISMNADGTYTFNTNNEFNDLTAGQSRETAFVYFASDADGNKFRGTITFTINGANDAAATTSIDRITTTEGEEHTTSLVNLQEHINDPDDTYTFTTTSTLPEGLTLNSDGTLTGTTGDSAQGLYEIDVLATASNSGETHTLSFEIMVNNESVVAPITTDGSYTISEDEIHSGNIFADGHVQFLGGDINSLSAIFYTGSIRLVDPPEVHILPTEISASNGGKIIMNPDGSYTFNPNGDFDDLKSGQSRDSAFVYFVSDADNNIGRGYISFTITGADDTATIILDRLTTFEGNQHDTALIDLRQHINDPDDTYTFTTTSNLPEGLVLNSNGTITGTVGDASEGLYEINVLATAGNSGETHMLSFEIMVDDGVSIQPIVPIISAATYTLGEDASHSGDVFTDGVVSYAGGDIATLSIISYSGDVSLSQAPDVQTLPTQFAASNGGTISMNADGTYTFNTNDEFNDLTAGQSRETAFVYFVQDENGNKFRGTITFTISGANDAATTTSIDRITTTEGEEHATALIDLRQHITDVDDSYTFTTTSSLPEGLVLNSDGTITGTIASNTARLYEIDVLATASNSGETHSLSFEIMVDEAISTLPVANDENIFVTEDDKIITGRVANGESITILGAQQNHEQFPLGEAIKLIGGGEFILHENGEYQISLMDEYQFLVPGQFFFEVIQYQISDGQGGTITNNLTIVISGRNDTPYVLPPQTPDTAQTFAALSTATNAIPEQTYKVGETIEPLALSRYFGDIDRRDGVQVAINEEDLPQGLVYNRYNDTISGTIDENAGAGTYSITATATDQWGATATTSFIFTIEQEATTPSQPEPQPEPEVEPEVLPPAEPEVETEVVTQVTPEVLPPAEPEVEPEEEPEVLTPTPPAQETPDETDNEISIGISNEIANEIGDETDNEVNNEKPDENSGSENWQDEDDYIAHSPQNTQSSQGTQSPTATQEAFSTLPQNAKGEITKTIYSISDLGATTGLATQHPVSEVVNNLFAKTKWLDDILSQPTDIDNQVQIVSSVETNLWQTAEKIRLATFTWAQKLFFAYASDSNNEHKQLDAQFIDERDIPNWITRLDEKIIEIDAPAEKQEVHLQFVDKSTKASDKKTFVKIELPSGEIKTWHSASPQKNVPQTKGN